MHRRNKIIRNNLTGLMITRQHTFKNNGGERDVLNFVRQFSKRDPHLKTFHQSGFLVSRETVVLRRWKSETKFWFYRTS